MRNILLFAGALLMLSAPVSAQMVESKVTASNGVVIDKNSDDFAGRFEYSAPVIRFQPTGGGSGVALVAKVRRNGVLGELNVQGFITYSGEWQYFDNAVFRGGEPVDYKRTGGDVGSCRYGCTLTENYIIHITPTQLKKYSENGYLPIQIRASKSSNTAILNIPVSFIDAVNEVAK